MHIQFVDSWNVSYYMQAHTRTIHDNSNQILMVLKKLSLVLKKRSYEKYNL